MPYEIIITEPEAIKDDSSTLTQITKKQQGINKLQIPKPKRNRQRKETEKTKMKTYLEKQEKREKYPSQIKKKKNNKRKQN